MHILTPKMLLPSDLHDLPCFFLAGPIRGGGDWQSSMCHALSVYMQHEDFVVVCPSRWTNEHALSKYFIGGRATDVFPRQLEWERYYLEYAALRAHRGAIVFWLPVESARDPHPGPEPYAMDTRGELGEWRARMKSEHARVIIGADPAFLGLSQIERNFAQHLRRRVPIMKTLESTAGAAAAAIWHL